MMRLRMSNRIYDEANQNIGSAIKVNDIEFVPTVSEDVGTYGMGIWSISDQGRQSLQR